MRFECNKLASALGAEVVGMDLRSPDVGFIKQALYENLVLVFREQILTSEEHVTLAREFGRPMRWDDPNVPPIECIGDFPEILKLSDRAGHFAAWHTDLTFLETPLWLGILRSVECPPIGGDTIWSNQYLAYERLSAPMRKMLSKQRAVHEAGLRCSDGELVTNSAVHPVFRMIPETGRECLYVNRGTTSELDGFPEAEGDAILQYLFTLSEDPAFQFRHRWSAGDVVMWDNRCTQHYAVNDYTEFRWVERVSVYE